jgi:hypothetical protein
MSATIKFSHSPKTIAKSLGVSVADARRIITMKILEELLPATPVDNGTLRASWFTSDGAPSPKKAPEKKRSPDGATQEAMSNISATFSDPGEVTYITNNLPYAMRIEFEGHSKVKAPAGMVRISLANVAAEFGSLNVDL